MNSGMMWFDNTKAGLVEKIEQAVAYYRKKYGVAPNFCLVHPGTLDGRQGGEEKFGEVMVREYRPVLPGHLWIGVEDAAQGVERASAELVRQAEELDA